MWLFFYPSGNPAAFGFMKGGRRDGNWQFFYDAPDLPLLSTGEFYQGYTSGEWRHYSRDGSLVAQMLISTLELSPRGGVKHTMYSVGWDISNVSYINASTVNGDQLYIITDEGGSRYAIDPKGNFVLRKRGQWRAKTCDWPVDQLIDSGGGPKAIEDDDQLPELSRTIQYESYVETCSATSKPVSKARSQSYDQIFKSLKTLYTPDPHFDDHLQAAYREPNTEEEQEEEPEEVLEGAMRPMRSIKPRSGDLTRKIS